MRTHVNIIEAVRERASVNVKVELRSTLTFTRALYTLFPFYLRA